MCLSVCTIVRLSLSVRDDCRDWEVNRRPLVMSNGFYLVVSFLEIVSFSFDRSFVASR